MASPPRHGAPGLPGSLGSPSHSHSHNHNHNNNNNSGVRKCGYLRKQKHGHKRFFVLRGPGAAGGDEQHPQQQPPPPPQPPRLEYYESEKKWRSKAGAPKRVIALDCCLNVNKRADAKHKYLIALYTRDEYFAVAADSEQEQDGWYRALTELVSEGRAAQAAAAAAAASDAPRAALAASCSASLPGALGSSSTAASAGAEDAYGPGGAPGAAAYREVWQVNLKPKGLGQTKNLTGVYRLCLSARTVGFVKLNCEQPSVTLQLMNIRRCGHSDSFFFIEVGRSAVTGPGELWMQADDSVVAQHIHETILEAMKALKELFEFRPRSKSQSSATHPISVPGARRHHHHHLVQLPPSQTGLVRRSRTDSLAATPPASKCASCRVRTASEGESGAAAGAAGTPVGTPVGRPVSVAGSPLSPGPVRAPLSRSHTLGGGGRAAAKVALLPAGGALQHSRSMSMPVAHSPPAATSPGAGSLSSSGGGHGSASAHPAHPAAPRPSSGSASASGSPSDPGFMSLDESGSSPGDLRSFCGHRSNTPDCMAETPPARDGPGGGGGELYGGYMTMDRPLSHCGRPYRRVSGDTPDLERGLRQRTYSLTTPARQRPTPQPASGSLDEYTLMRATFAGSHGRLCPSCPVASSPSPKVAYYPYPDDYGDVEIASQRSSSGHLGPDDGYVPMTPGAVLRGPTTAGSGRRGDEYMPMSPTSVSAPQQILKPRGATMGSLGPASNTSTPSSLAAVLRAFPGSGKAGSPVGSSPEDSGYMRMWSGPKVPVEAPDTRLLSSDYLNMSPSDAGPAGTPPDFFSVSGYGHMHGHGHGHSHADGCPSSLPRAYKDHDHYVLMSSPVGRILEEERPEPVPAPSPVATRPENLAMMTTRSRAVRPTRLSLDGLQTLPCMHESPLPPEPQSPGEYINIDFGEAGARLLGSATSSSSLLSAGSPASSLGSGTPGTSSDSRQRSPLSDYMNLDFSSPRPGQAGTVHPLGSLDGPLFTRPAAPSVAARAAVPPVPRPPSHGELYHQPAAAPTAAQGHGGATLASSSATTSASDSDYTEMAFGVAATSPQPIAAPPKPEGPRLSSPTSGVKRLSLMEQVSGLEAFLQVSQPADPHRGAKVIRADPQGGRRRHSSETFSSTTTVTPVSPSFAHTPKRHNSASVENVSLRKSSEGALGGSSGVLGLAHDTPASPHHQQPSLAPATRPWTASPVGGLVGGPMRRETSAGFQNGLNYIAIDVRDQLPPDKGTWGRTRSLGGLIGAVSGGGGSVCGGPGPAPNTYASIDFLSHHLKEAAVVKE